MRPFLLLLVALSACTPDRRDAPVTVSAAASLREVMTELEAEYEAANPGVEVRTNFGASGALRQQIEQGAPVDLFVSAAAAPMDALAKSGRVDAATRRVLAGNELVLIVPAQGSPVRAFADLARADVRRVALGAPASVPAGEYAQDVRQVLAFVSSGNADAGIVYRTDAAVTQRVRVAAVAPEGSHRAIAYPVAVVLDGPNAEGARAYLAFLLGPAGRAALRRRGFRVEG